VRIVATASVLLILACTAQANSFPYSGTFLHDDQVQGFFYTVQNAGPVHVYTTSYGTGTAGSGFLPVLTIFDNAIELGGVFLFSDETAYSRNADADIGPLQNWNAAAGAGYYVYVTEYNNVWDQLNDDWSVLEDPFHDPDFTTALYGLGTGPFYGPGPDGNGAQLTGDWTVVFESADPTFLAVPEPGSWSLLACGALALACARKFRWVR